MAKQKVLIAEDDKVTQALYKKGLTEKVCDLKIVSNGEQAIEAFKEWQPNIILLDISMPIMNGFECLKAIRQLEGGNSCSIIIVTSSADKESIMACAKIGIQGYVVKPFKSDEIAVKIFKIHNDYLQKK